jgi:hypothetical protein
VNCASDSLPEIVLYTDILHWLGAHAGRDRSGRSGYMLHQAGLPAG